eukprot:3018337-Amphidinium_carterae.1
MSLAPLQPRLCPPGRKMASGESQGTLWAWHSIAYLWCDNGSSSLLGLSRCKESIQLQTSELQHGPLPRLVAAVLASCQRLNGKR